MSVKSLRWGLVVAAVLALVPVRWQLASGGPTTEDPETVSTHQTIPEMGYELDPPPAGYQPTVSWDAAVALAKGREEVALTATISGTLGLLTNPNWVPVTDERAGAPQGEVLGPPLIQKVPVWLVTIDGVCIPSYGGQATSRGQCAGTQATFVIHAESGEVIEEYSNQ